MSNSIKPIRRSFGKGRFVEFLKKYRFSIAYVLFCSPFILAFILATRGTIILPQSISFLFGIQLKLYSLCILAGIGFVTLIASERALEFKELKEIKVDELLMVVVLPGLIGARIFYVLEFWSYYQNQPQEAFAVWNGGLSIFGALAGGLMALFLYSQKTKFNFVMLLDLIIMHVPLAQVLGRYGNFANQEHFGPKTDLPWGIFISSTGTYHHPAFLYEQLGNLILYFVLLTVFRKDKLKTSGLLSAVYLIGYGIVRFSIDIFRTDARVVAGLTVAQIISVGFVFAGLVYLGFKRKNFAKQN